MHLQYISSHSTRIHSQVSQIAVLSVSLQNSLKVCVYLKQSSQAVDLILLTVPSRLLMQFDAVCIPRTLRSSFHLLFSLPVNSSLNFFHTEAPYRRGKTLCLAPNKISLLCMCAFVPSLPRQKYESQRRNEKMKLQKTNVISPRLQVAHLPLWR